MSLSVVLAAWASTRRVVLALLALGATAAALVALPAQAQAVTTHHGHHHRHHGHHHRHHHKGSHHNGSHHSSSGQKQTAGKRVPAVPARTATETSIANDVLRELNAERAANNLPALNMNTHLMLSARRHDVLMAQDNTMSHQLTNEPVFTDRESTAGYKWMWAGENIGWNSDMSSTGAVYLEKLMYGEKPPNDGHRQNILNTHYRDVGVDILMDQANHKVWLTTDFGSH